MTQYSTGTPGLVASLFTPFFLQERGSDTSENTSSRDFSE
jgi:hypothetical protein